jgi:hypothetical protein
MEYFVSKGSIVREIWGKSDTILFIFAGASAEFALNKAVDWLYFTGRLPADPLGRLFTTVSYARANVFYEKHAAEREIDSIAAIHAAVEAKRGERIPDWAYRDVLFMLIDYSFRSFEVLQRKLSRDERNEVFQVFSNVGNRMGIKGLPGTLEEWDVMRDDHLNRDLQRSELSDDLFNQYRKHLGNIRYQILLETQALVAPAQVRRWLRFRKISLLYPLLLLYKLLRIVKLGDVLKNLILPAQYKKEIMALDSTPGQRNDPTEARRAQDAKPFMNFHYKTKLS